MRVDIVQGGALVGTVDDWQGPLPGKGDYIFHPPFAGESESGVMSVKVVTFRMLTRPVPAVGHFTGHPDPYVEICV